MKWILGILAAVIVVIAAVAWLGYRKLKEFATTPPVSTVTIAAPPSRVFAALASGDSLSTWMLNASSASTSRAGVLMVGDTVKLERPTGIAPGSARDSLLQSSSSWVVTEVVRDRLLAMERRLSGRRGEIGIQRRDSLIAVGDSTRIVSTYSSADADSLGLDPRTGRRGAIAGMAVKVMMGAMRMQSDIEHSRMKDHIERGIEPAGAPRKTP